MLDFVVGLETEFNELMDGSNLYTPKVDLNDVVIPKEDLVFIFVTYFYVFEYLAKQYRKEMTPRIGGEYRLGDVRHISANMAKLKKIGFEPLVTFQAGMAKYVEWICSMGNVKEYFSDVENALRRSGVIRGRQNQK